MRTATEWTVVIRGSDGKVTFKRAAPAHDAEEALRLALEDMAVAWDSLLEALRQPPRKMAADLASLHDTHESADAPRWSSWQIGASMARAAKANQAGSESEADARRRIARSVQILFDHEMDLQDRSLAEQARTKAGLFMRTECSRALPSMTDEIVSNLFDNGTGTGVPMTRETQLALLAMGVSYLVARRPKKRQTGDEHIPYSIHFDTAKVQALSATLSAAHAIAEPERKAAHLEIIRRTPGFAKRQETIPC